MKLHRVKILIGQTSGEILPVITRRRRVFAGLDKVSVDKIYKRIIGYVCKKRPSKVRDLVPPHVRNFQGVTRESPDAIWHQSETVCIVFLGRRAHKLHPETHAEYRLPQRTNYLVEPAGPKICHRSRSFTHSREDYLFSGSQHF